MGKWSDMWRAAAERKNAAKLAQQASREANDPYVQQANDIVAGRGLKGAAPDAAPAPTTYAQRRFGLKEGGKVSAAEAVHKHERNMHKGKPLTKMAKGGSASKRADGIARKGKTKGRMI